MQMTATAKFLFDQDFGSGGKPMISLADHNTKVAQIEQIAYRNGFAAAQAQAAAEAERSLAAMLNTAATRFDGLRRDLATLETRLEAEAVDVALAVALKLAPTLIAREPLAELSALTSDCFRHLVGAPHLVVRVSETLYEPARDALAGIAHDRGFEGRLVVLADPDIAPGDCRIEWADGGIVRDRKATDTAIAELIGRYLGGRQSGAAPQPPVPEFVGRKP
jgi:flagellar assembly protein FliH